MLGCRPCRQRCSVRQSGTIEVFPCFAQISDFPRQHELWRTTGSPVVSHQISFRPITHAVRSGISCLELGSLVDRPAIAQVFSHGMADSNAFLAVFARVQCQADSQKTCYRNRPRHDGCDLFNWTRLSSSIGVKRNPGITRTLPRFRLRFIRARLVDASPPRSSHPVWPAASRW